MTKLHTGPSAARISALALAVAVASAATAAQAHQPASTKAAKPSAKPAPTAATRATLPAAMPGLTIARDADTGVLRAPTPQEAAALSPAAPQVEGPLVEFDAGNGLIGVNIPTSMMSYTVVARSADGSLSQVCLPNEKSANDVVRKLTERAAQPVVPRAPSLVQVRRTATEAQLRPAAGAPNE